MKKVLLVALLFAACSKKDSKPETPKNDGCGVIVAVSGTAGIDWNTSIFTITNTYTILWKDGTTSKITKDNEVHYVGDSYCK